MLREGRGAHGQRLVGLDVPRVALLLTCLAVNRIGDRLRDFLDPSMRDLDQEHSG